MSEIVVTAAIAPMMADPSPRAELVSQMVMGYTGRVEEERDTWLRVTAESDGYPGWIHRGYVRLLSSEEAASWRERANFLSDGAMLENASRRWISLPLLARAAASADQWELASGWRGRLAAGSVLSAQAMTRSARGTRPIDWATAHFSGTPYLWGGVTPWGVDCSGLVQTTFAARGQVLPRDSREQAKCGSAVAPAAIEPGDLLFFSESGSRITHVAFAGEGETLVHSTLACGGFIVESWQPGSRASRLREQLVAVRRLTD
jgi:cell wall-associated NlpC family hydrolase